MIRHHTIDRSLILHRQTMLFVCALLLTTILASMPISPMAIAEDKRKNMVTDDPGTLLQTESDENSETQPKSLSGKIIDETGAAVPGVILKLFDRNGAPQPLQSTTTDENGCYSFPAVREAAVFFLEVDAQFYKNPAAPDRRLRIELDPNSNIVRDFILTRLCRIKIRAVDSDTGEPVPLTMVYCLLPSDSPPFRSGASVTDKDGWVEIGCTGDTSAKYLIGTSHRDYAFEHIEQLLNDPDRVPRRTIFMRRGISIQGKAICSDDLPPTGWRIGALPSWLPLGYALFGSTVDDEGNFQIDHVVPGKYNLMVSIPRKNGMISLPILNNTELSEADQPLNVRLDYPSPKGLVTIAGKAQVEENLNRPGAIRVEARTPTGQGVLNAIVRPDTREFRFEQIPKGVYHLRFSHPGLETLLLKNVEAPNEDLSVTLKLKSKIRLRGIVIDEKTEKPVKDFAVRIRRIQRFMDRNPEDDDSWTAVSDPSGNFDLPVPSPGTFQAMVTTDGFAPAKSERINPTVDKSTVLKIKMKIGSPLTGVVLDEAGNPIDGAIVASLSRLSFEQLQQTAAPNDPANTVKTKDGNFTFHNLADDEESFRITHPNYCTTEFTRPRVRPGATDTSRITLTQGATISGGAYDAKDQLIPAVVIDLHNTEIHEMTRRPTLRYSRIKTDLQGAYQVSHLPSQLICISRPVTDDFVGVARRSVQTENGQHHKVDLGGNTRVSGRIVLNGTPLVNSHIQLGEYQPSTGVMQNFAVTDLDGSFEFHGTPPGKWSLHFLNSRNHWIRLRDVTVPASGNLQLGNIDHNTQRVTVEIDPPIPQTMLELGLRLREFHQTTTGQHEVGELNRRDSPSDPFYFDFVSQGDYVVVCNWPNHPETIQRVSVTADDVNPTVTMKLPIGLGSVGGTIDEQFLQRWPLASLNLWSSDLRYHVPVQPSDEGKFQIRNLPAGKYDFRCSSSRTAPIVVSFTLSEGEKKVLNINAEQANQLKSKNGFLSVKVFVDDVIPIPCDVKIENDQGILTTLSGQFGSTYFWSAPGTYRILINLPGFKAIAKTVEIRPTFNEHHSTEEHQLNLKLERE